MPGHPAPLAPDPMTGNPGNVTVIPSRRKGGRLPGEEQLIDRQLLEKLERLTLQWRKSFAGLVGGHNLRAIPDRVSSSSTTVLSITATTSAP